MSIFNFPQKVYSGINSVEKIFDKDYESVLIISDGVASQRNGTLLKLKRKFDSSFTRCEVIISDDADELFENSKKFVESHIPEAIIAIGDGKTIDCGGAVSRLCNIPFVSIVETLPSSLTEFDTLDLFLYKNTPDICILDPAFIVNSDSSKTAYEALGTACLALECATLCADRYIKAIAEKSFCEIYKNILPAYRGEISARENLCYAMYSAFIAFINSFEYSWESISFRTATFFSKWNSEKISSLAVCITNISEYLYEKYPENFGEIAKQLKLTPMEELAPSFLIDEIRRIQATLTIPFALRNFMIDEDEFLESCNELSQVDKDIFSRCFYGNATFIKS